MQDDANQRNRHQHRERRVGIDVRGGCRLRDGPATVQGMAAGPDEAGGQDAEAKHAKRTVRRTAMPFQIGDGAAGGGDDVDVGRVRCEEQRRRRAAPGAPEWRARQRQREEAVCQVIQSR